MDKQISAIARSVYHQVTSYLGFADLAILIHAAVTSDWTAICVI